MISGWIKIVMNVCNKWSKTYCCIQNREEKPTLAYWCVVANSDILHALQDFAKSNRTEIRGISNNNDKKIAFFTDQVQDLFTRLNSFMLHQERDLIWPEETYPLPQPPLNQCSVVFGGKWSAKPTSISEKLVSLLASAENAHVFTVSRSTMSSTILPSNVTHVAKQNLDQVKGDQEFTEVMKMGLENVCENKRTTQLAFHFTLGQHTGPNKPFQRNIQAAENFSKALINIIADERPGVAWKVIITGTDATQPSTQPDGVCRIEGVDTVIPTYKILPYNFVYAASKLCQFFSIAAAVAKLVNKDTCIQLLSTTRQHDGSLLAIAEQLKSYFYSCGNNGTFQSNDFITPNELDEISRHWYEVAEPALQEHLQIAKNISICYTPLHRNAWVKAAFEQSEIAPETFLIEQVVRRFKNAISIERAARVHL